MYCFLGNATIYLVVQTDYSLMSFYMQKVEQARLKDSTRLGC